MMGALRRRIETGRCTRRANAVASSRLFPRSMSNPDGADGGAKLLAAIAAAQAAGGHCAHQDFAALLEYGAIANARALRLWETPDCWVLWSLCEGRGGVRARLSLALGRNLAQIAHSHSAKQLPGVHILCSTYGQAPVHSVVLRFLAAGSGQFSLERLGLASSDETAIRQALSRRQGLVLVAGPADPGKTSALFAMARIIDPLARSIHVIGGHLPAGQPEWQHWPLEHCDAQQREIAACTALEQALSMEAGVVLLDEIRSRGVAGLLLHAVDRGCLVLSSVVANRANHVFAALQALGVEANEVARALSIVMAQRLVPALCGSRALADDSQEVRAVLAPAMNTWLEPAGVRARAQRMGGCERCGGEGYCGRALANECLQGDSSMRALVEAGGYRTGIGTGPAGRGPRHLGSRPCAFGERRNFPGDPETVAAGTRVRRNCDRKGHSRVNFQRNKGFLAANLPVKTAPARQFALEIRWGAPI